MNTVIWGMVLKTVGEVILGLAVILVHHQIVSEHKISKKVLNLMHREQALAGLGIVFVLGGFLMEISYYL